MMRAYEQVVAEKIVRAVASEGVVRGTVLLAKRLVEKWDEREAKAKEEPAPAPKKPPVPSVEHHAKAVRTEEREAEKTSTATWLLCVERSRIDHRLVLSCEACHKPKEVEPHHLILGARTDAPEVVICLCADCHRLDPKSAHRSPRWFAQNVVIPWLDAHGYPRINRKEYRT